LRFISSRTFSALLPDQVLFALVVFAAFFGALALETFADFLLSFAFFVLAV